MLFSDTLFCPQSTNMADALEVEDVEAAGWFRWQAEEIESVSTSSGDPDPGEEGQIPLRRHYRLGQLHLLLGCSITCDAKLACQNSDDIILNLAMGGNTWAKVTLHLSEDLRSWEEAAEAFGCNCGRVIIWLSENEAYNRNRGVNLLLDAPRGPLEATIRGVLEDVRVVATPVVLGPLPRFWNDRLAPWEQSASYLLDRKVHEAARDDEFFPLGRSFTVKMAGRHVIGDRVQDYFCRDGIHLTRAGYLRVATRFPAWLRVESE